MPTSSIGLPLSKPALVLLEYLADGQIRWVEMEPIDDRCSLEQASQRFLIPAFAHLREARPLPAKES